MKRGTDERDAKKHNNMHTQNDTIFVLSNNAELNEKKKEKITNDIKQKKHYIYPVWKIELNGYLNSVREKYIRI